VADLDLGVGWRVCPSWALVIRAIVNPMSHGSRGLLTNRRLEIPLGL
jgi:hypothetical protein